MSPRKSEEDIVNPRKSLTRIVGFLQSVNKRKDENPTRKTCSEYFNSYGVTKMRKLDGDGGWGLYIKNSG